MSIARALFIAVLVYAGAAVTSHATADEQLTGTWLTQDGSTRVSFRSCGSALCGQIVWLSDPIDPATGNAWADKFNANEALRRRPLIGLPLISGLEETAPGTWAGTLYNPLDGKSYSGKLEMIDTQRLHLKGCAYAGLLCQTETWAKVK